VNSATGNPSRASAIISIDEATYGAAFAGEISVKPTFAEATFDPEYEVVYYDRKGRLERTVRMVCASDEAALEATARIRSANALELWEGNRLLWRFDARPIA
jgi:hypothetical protein